MKRTIRRSLAILAFLAITTGSFAQAGALDPTFATAGIGSYAPQMLYIEQQHIIALADNSILVCGQYVQNTTYGGFITHILEDGSVDTSFGESNGYTYMNTAYFSTMALAPDQSIYLAGYGAPVNSGISITHVSASGIPDPDFGTNGVVTNAIAISFREVPDMVIQPDGKIVLVGSGDLYVAYDHYDFFFLRYLPDGSLDTSFNGTGMVTMPSTSTTDNLQAVALLDDGSILGAGYRRTVDGVGHCLLIKLNADGTPYPSFGTGGILLPSFTYASETVFGMTVKDGFIYTVGDAAYGNAPHAYIAKFNADGTFDTTFGTNGSTLTDVSDALVRPAAQSDGKIVVCGGWYGASGNDFPRTLTVRYGTDGLLDPTFGVAGKKITNVGLFSDQLTTIAIQPDGKIVTAGFRDDTQDVPFLIAMRYLGDGSVGLVEDEDPTGRSTVFPNPVTGTSTTLQLRDGNGAEVWTSDLEGRMVGKAVHVPRGATSVQMNVKDLVAGMYLVNVLSAGNTRTLKMQVTK